MCNASLNLPLYCSVGSTFRDTVRRELGIKARSRTTQASSGHEVKNFQISQDSIGSLSLKYRDFVKYKVRFSITCGRESYLVFDNLYLIGFPC